MSGSVASGCVCPLVRFVLVSSCAGFSSSLELDYGPASLTSLTIVRHSEMLHRTRGFHQIADSLVVESRCQRVGPSPILGRRIPFCCRQRFFLHVHVPTRAWVSKLTCTAAHVHTCFDFAREVSESNACQTTNQIKPRDINRRARAGVSGKQQKNKKNLRRPGFGPGSSAWEAEILTTVLSAIQPCGMARDF